jgi:hypothetical protein
MKKSRIIKISLLILVLISTFLLVYSPHFNYPYPLHIDEWHAIQEAQKLNSGEYIFHGRTGDITQGFELGFHFFLLILLKFVNLVSFYKFLPAIWAVITSLTLFYTLYKKTNNFTIGLLAMIFFASLKSNVNLAGLWFFTPLIFGLPFIFLYIYFFTEGIEKQNKKFILISLGIMTLLIFIHSISVLFAFPFLFIYLLFHLRYIKKEYKFFSVLLIIPVLGILFYSIMQQLSPISSIFSILHDLQFRYGWGVLELNNSFTELYSIAGFILAGIGIAGIFLYKQQKKYLIYLLWPSILLISIYFYKLFGFSFLSPYQRNMYYFAVAMPILSALGLFYISKGIKSAINKTAITEKTKNYIKIIFLSILYIGLIFFTFQQYYSIPKQIDIYHLIEPQDYPSLLYLSTLPKGIVMADASISTTIYPISHQETVGTIWFYGNRSEVNSFFNAKDCQTAQQILKRNNVSYILSKRLLACNWKLVYSNYNNIYKVI